MLSEEDLEVVLVYDWDPTAEDSSPEVEVVPVDSLEEAERVIEEAMEPGSGVISASLNLPSTRRRATRLGRRSPRLPRGTPMR